MKKLSIFVLAAIFLLPCNIAATKLHDTCNNGDLQEVKKLISDGADVNAKDQWGDTPLHRAAYKGHEKIVKVLLGNKADVNAKGAHINSEGYNYNSTPLHIATRNSYEKIAEILLNNSANVNIRDSIGNTPLHLAARNNLERSVMLILNKGAEANATDKSGNAPLHWASVKGYEGVTKQLVAAPLLLKQSNGINLQLSKETLNNLDVSCVDDSNKILNLELNSSMPNEDEFFRLFKELPVPALRSVAKNMFPVKDDSESIIKALLKFSYQDLEQKQSAFANLFIREFYKNHLAKLKLFIAVKNKGQETAIWIANAHSKNNIVEYLTAIENAQNYNELDENLRTQTKKNYQQLVNYNKVI